MWSWRRSPGMDRRSKDPALGSVATGDVLPVMWMPLMMPRIWPQMAVRLNCSCSSGLGSGLYSGAEDYKGSMLPVRYSHINECIWTYQVRCWAEIPPVSIAAFLTASTSRLGVFPEAFATADVVVVVVVIAAIIIVLLLSGWVIGVAVVLFIVLIFQTCFTLQRVWELCWVKKESFKPISGF